MKYIVSIVSSTENFEERQSLAAMLRALLFIFICLQLIKTSISIRLIAQDKPKLLSIFKPWKDHTTTSCSSLQNSSGS
jgi:molybdopterin/thiamine biosynthesis adenylyltransferase